MPIVTVADLATIALTDPEMQRAFCLDPPEAVRIDPPYSNNPLEAYVYEISGYLSENSACSATYQAALRELDFEIRDDTIAYNPSNLPALAAIARSIMTDYDGAIFGNETGAWGKYNLGGDDDVDYAGGFLLCIVEALQRYETLK